uniref:Syndecan n=1 Tax=Oryctolagus cuniculus TaxID=9986 RepID=G1SI13_RABIT
SNRKRKQERVEKSLEEDSGKKKAEKVQGGARKRRSTGVGARGPGADPARGPLAPTGARSCQSGCNPKLHRPTRKESAGESKPQPSPESSREQPPREHQLRVGNQQVRGRRAPGAQRGRREQAPEEEASAPEPPECPRARAPELEEPRSLRCFAPDPSARAARSAGQQAFFALVENRGWEQPFPGEYAACVDPAHLGLGGLRVGRVGADEDIESPELTTSRPFLKIPFTSAAPKVETTTLKIQNKMPAQTKSPEEIDKEKVHLSDSERKMDPAEEGTNVFTEKHSDNLFKRTEVLAAVIAGGVIGFLFAIFLILLLVYRMRKKDEGSYDLGERKPSSAAYQKAPTKEFYA